MFTPLNILVYLGIFFAKLIEVTIATLRIVLINRGQRKLGAVLAFFEVLIWLFVVSIVLKDITSDYFKVIIYCLAFACGNFMGSVLEEKLAIGMSVMEVYVTREIAGRLVDALRQDGFGVTTIDSHGKDNEMVIMRVYLKRKQLDEATRLVKGIAPAAIVTAGDIKRITGGYIK
ncbi:MAG: DUF5698 domain-containing protein [Oscillospiraceae bacterium]|nr:DUF5698 domain-containing protein [Oscillospiraceae bacterium]